MKKSFTLLTLIAAAALTSCTEDSSLPSCQSDFDCKGGRICAEGTCQDKTVVVPTETDQDGDGYDSIFHGGEDCDDYNPSIFPGQIEYCNSIDDNCKGGSDEIGCGTLFIENQDGREDHLYFLDLTTFERQEIKLPEPYTPYFPAQLSPDDCKFLFKSFTNNQYDGFFEYNLSTKRLTLITDLRVRNSSWFPDSTTIIYSALDGDWPNSDDTKDTLFIQKITSTTNTPVVSFPRAYSILDPTVSPNERYLAFSGLPPDSEDPERNEIYMIRRNGDDLTRLTFTSSEGSMNLNPAWKDNSTLIYDCVVRPNGSTFHNLCSVNTDGSDQYQAAEKYSHFVVDPNSSRVILSGPGMIPAVCDSASRTFSPDNCFPLIGAEFADYVLKVLK